LKPFGSWFWCNSDTEAESAGGIIFTTDTTETDKWNTQAAKVIAVGSVGLPNRNTHQHGP